MMPVWQEDRRLDGTLGPKCFKAQSVRKDGHRAELFACDDGSWIVRDLCDTGPHFTSVASGKAPSLDAAQLIARIVWELSVK